MRYEDINKEEIIGYYDSRVLYRKPVTGTAGNKTWSTIGAFPKSMYPYCRINFGLSYVLMNGAFILSVDSALGTGGMVRYNINSGAIEIYNDNGANTLQFIVFVEYTRA